MTDKVLNEKDTAKGSVKTLIIIRGLPGSGKTFVGSSLVMANSQLGENTDLWEADDYFYKDGNYKFISEEVHKAHKACYENVEASCKVNVRTVIVSNTATRQWEYKKYIALAREYGYKVQVIDIHGEFENVHGVPEEHLTKMEERWEPFNRELLSSRHGE